MKCYFCSADASVQCTCQRCVCKTHSRQTGGLFFCFECALGGPDGIYGEALRLVLSLKLYQCSECEVRGINRPELNNAIQHLCLSTSAIVQLHTEAHSRHLDLGHYLCEDFSKKNGYYFLCSAHSSSTYEWFEPVNRFFPRYHETLGHSLDICD
jgi:hypothetical protein